MPVNPFEIDPDADHGFLPPGVGDIGLADRHLNMLRVWYSAWLVTWINSPGNESLLASIEAAASDAAHRERLFPARVDVSYATWIRMEILRSVGEHGFPSGPNLEFLTQAISVAMSVVDWRLVRDGLNTKDELA